MRIRLLTDTRIETYAPTGAGRVGAVVTKVPSGESGYEILVQLECYGSIPCTDIQAKGSSLFNQLVNGVVKRRMPSPN